MQGEHNSLVGKPLHTSCCPSQVALLRSVGRPPTCTAHIPSATIARTVAITNTTASTSSFNMAFDMLLVRQFNFPADFFL